MSDRRRKLSATALSTFLESPRKYYYTYILKLEPLMPSMGNFDHDKLLGILWAEFVDRFYKDFPEQENLSKLLADWTEQTHGWVTPKKHDEYSAAATAWSTIYYQFHNSKDGVRNGSEKHVENDRFIGYIDGLSADETILHEVKTTSRAKAVSEQLWKVQNSIQVKLYCVLTGCSGVCIEFAYKDQPYSIFRAPVLNISAEQRDGWEQELNTLADYIVSLSDDIHNYPCHSDGCCITTKNFVGMCEFQALCSDGINDITKIAFKERISTRKK